MLGIHTSFIHFTFPFQGRYPDTDSSYTVSASVHQMYGNYNQMNSSHQERYYHSAQTNFNHSDLRFPDAFPTPPQSSYPNIDYHVNIEHEVLPPPLLSKHHPPPPSPIEFEALSDKDLAGGNSCHIHPLINNLKHARKSNRSELTTRLQSSLRYLLPEAKRNK
jgi:hypothetical protein